MPKVSQSLSIPDYNLQPSDLPAKKNKFITFGCFNQYAKINNKVIELWSKILKAVKNSKLILKSAEFSNNKVSQNILDKFKKFGINQNRVILKGKSDNRKEVLETYNLIDICLDPFPFQGNTSTCESVWMGVPVLTLKGNRYLYRFGESINLNLEMKDWIASTKEDYIKKAITFSADIEKLSEIRNGLRKKSLSSPVFDSDEFSKDFSEMLSDLWKNLKN